MPKNKKIIFVQESFGSLSEVFLYRLNVSLPNFKVNVMTGRYTNREAFPFDEKKIHIWNYNDISFIDKIIPYINRKINHRGSYSGIYKNIILQINQSNADLICFQFSFLAVAMGTDINKIKKKMCIIHHGTDINKAIEDKDYRLRLQRMWKSMNKIIFVSHFLKNIALSLGCPESKTIVHYLGVPKINETQQNAINDTFRFISVARLVPVKNHLNLIRAFSELLKQTNKKVELVLVGAGELETKIKKEIYSLGVEKNVKLLGGMVNNKVLPEIKKSDTLILISKVYIVKGITNQQEGLPISLLEGASLGLPLIGSNTGGIPEIITHNKNGYLVNPLDIYDICNAMFKMINDPVKSKQMGEKSKKLIERKFCMEKQMEILENIFSNIISQ